VGEFSLSFPVSSIDSLNESAESCEAALFRQAYNGLANCIKDDIVHLNKPNTLEFIIGTRWAVADLYEYILTNDPTVEWIVRSIVEDQKPIWPEAFIAKPTVLSPFSFGRIVVL